MTGRAVALGLAAAMALGVAASAPAASDATVGTLAFDVPAEGYSTALIVRTDGSGLRELRIQSADSLGPENPSWSPDGRRILFTDIDGVWTVASGGGRVTKIDMRDEDFYGYARWSPDGTRVVYEGNGITTAAVSGRGHRRVRLPFYARYPDWSPNGKKLAFVRQPFGENEPGEIYVANVDGSGLRRITRNTMKEDDYGVRWSPDGRKVLFVRSTRRGTSGNYFTTEVVYSVSAAGGPLTRLISGTRNQGISSVSWSPDGKEIAYMAHPKIHVFTLATREDRAFTPAPCRGVDTDAYESCDHVDWRWAKATLTRRTRRSTS